MANEVMSLAKRAASYSSELDEWIKNDVTKKGLVIPEGYNYVNEVMSAMLHIANNAKDKNGRPAMEVCTKDSILTTIKDMVITGLSITRKQVYPIIYGDKLSLQTSYFGAIAGLRNIFPYFKVTSNVLYEGDKFDYCYDEEGEFHYIQNVRSSLENRDKPIIAAYASLFDTRKKERIYGQVMTRKEIEVCWSHSPNKAHTVHNEFPQEMAQRTVINRLCKRFTNTSTYRDGTNKEAIASFARLANAEYDFDKEGAIETTSEPITDTKKAIHGRSKGESGLSALLEKRNKQDEPRPERETAEEPAEKTTVDEPIEEKQEIIPKEPESASEPIVEAMESIPEEQESYDYDELPF